MEDILENMTTIHDDDKNDHAWGVPIRDDNLTNLSGVKVHHFRNICSCARLAHLDSLGLTWDNILSVCLKVVFYHN